MAFQGIQQDLEHFSELIAFISLWLLLHNIVDLCKHQIVVLDELQQFEAKKNLRIVETFPNLNFFKIQFNIFNIIFTC